MKTITVVIFSMFLIISTNAQDYHLTQFDAIPIMLNPGYTGLVNGQDYRAGSVYRSQWRPLASRPFSTFALSYDMLLKERWGIGGYIINSDGAKVYNSFNLVFSGSYEITEPNQEEYRMTGGLQVGFILNNTNDNDLTFDNQYNSGEFDINLPSLEQFDRFSKFMPEFTLGFLYETLDLEKDLKPYGGFSFHHLTSPKAAFIAGTDEAARLPRRYTFHGGANYEIDPEWDVDAKILTQFQGQAKEFVLGIQGNYVVNAEEKTKVSLGIGTRIKDSFILSTGIEYRNLTYGMSYDFTTSALKQYRSGGGLEFTFMFTPRL